MHQLQDILDQLPEVPALGYNGMTIAGAHWRRIAEQFTKSSPEFAEIPTTFCGIKIAVNPSVPEGYAVLTQNNEPVGILNFKDGTATLMKPRRTP